MHNYRDNNKNSSISIRTFFLVLAVLLFSYTSFGATSFELTTEDWINVFGNLNLTGNNLLNAGNVSIKGNLSVDGNASFDSGTLFIDSVNNNVGIGTLSPSEKLVVIGNVNISGTLNVTGRVSFPNLASCNTVDTDENGVLSCGTDATGTVTPG